MDVTPRLRAVCDLDVAVMRESSGRHEYDGKPQDLSPKGVRAGLARLAAARAGGERLADPHDEAHLAAAEDLRRALRRLASSALRWSADSDSVESCAD